MSWRDVTPINDEKTGEIIAAKLIIYPMDGDEYYTFITLEAYNALKEYIDYRRESGERIDGNSPLIRNKWRTVDLQSADSNDDSGGSGYNNGDNNDNKNKKYGYVGLITVPKRLSTDGIRKILNRALKAQKLRHLLPEGETRHEWKQAHGFRKYFYTHPKGADMIHDNVEYLMGHRSGNQGSYFKPEVERALLQDYLKAVDSLTINYDNNKAILQKEVAQLKEKSKEESYFVLGNLAEKEREAEDTKKQVEFLTEEHKKLRELISNNMSSMSSTLKMLTSPKVFEAGEISPDLLMEWLKNMINMMKVYLEYGIEYDNSLLKDDTLKHTEHVIKELRKAKLK